MPDITSQLIDEHPFSMTFFVFSVKYKVAYNCLLYDFNHIVSVRCLSSHLSV